MNRTKTKLATPAHDARTDDDDGNAIRDHVRSGSSATIQTDSDEHYFAIGELAEEFDITTRTIRFYEARGLLVPARFRSNRAYSRRDRARLKLILRGKNLGFSLEDIAEYLSLYDSDPGQVTQTKLLLDKIEAHITDLNSKRADLERTLTELKEIKAQCLGHLKRGK
jgi:DNA-binding transcriptional MerR regulator